MAAPAVEAVAKEYAGKVKVGKMAADSNVTPSQLGIRGIPTLLLFYDIGAGHYERAWARRIWRPLGFMP